MWWSLRTWKVAHRKFVALPNWVRWWFSSYPLVNIQKAIEHGHRNSEFSHEKWWFSSCKMVIFHSFLYVYQRVHVYKRGFRQGDVVHKIGWIRLGHPGLLAGLHPKKTCPMAKDIEFLNMYCIHIHVHTCTRVSTISSVLQIKPESIPTSIGSCLPIPLSLGDTVVLICSNAISLGLGVMSSRICPIQNSRPQNGMVLMC